MMSTAYVYPALHPPGFADVKRHSIVSQRDARRKLLDTRRNYLEIRKWTCRVSVVVASPRCMGC